MGRRVLPQSCLMCSKMAQMDEGSKRIKNKFPTSSSLHRCPSPPRSCQQQSTFVATRCLFDSWCFFFIQLSTSTSPPPRCPWSSFSVCTAHNCQLQCEASAIRTFISLFAGLHVHKSTYSRQKDWISHNVAAGDTNLWPSLTPVSHKFGSDYEL